MGEGHSRRRRASAKEIADKQEICRMANNPEVNEAIRIVENYIEWLPKEQCKALALEIQAAIVNHAGAIANDLIADALARIRH
jgi:hypothetical protein